MCVCVNIYIYIHIHTVASIYYRILHLLHILYYILAELRLSTLSEQLSKQLQGRTDRQMAPKLAFHGLALERDILYSFICIYRFLQVYVCVYIIYIYIYIYIYGKPPMNYRHSFLYRKYRVKSAFPAGPGSVSLEDYQNKTHISIERA